MGKVRMDFSAGRRFVSLAADAVADGITAATIAAQRITTRGMFQAPNAVTRKVSKGGLEYFAGPGAPIGGYPGVRTGNLERSLGIERAKVRQGGRVTGYFLDSASYAAAVHGSQTAPKRPYLTLPFTRNRGDIMRAFTRATARRLA